MAILVWMEQLSNVPEVLLGTLRRHVAHPLDKRIHGRADKLVYQEHLLKGKHLQLIHGLRGHLQLCPHYSRPILLAYQGHAQVSEVCCLRVNVGLLVL